MVNILCVFLGQSIRMSSRHPFFICQRQSRRQKSLSSSFINPSLSLAVPAKNSTFAIGEVKRAQDGRSEAHKSLPAMP